MNCRPGDIAVIVGVKRLEEVVDLGALVEVVGLDENYTEPHWDVRAISRPITAFFDDSTYRLAFCEVSVADRCLRPIRDPGGKAEDETLRIAGKPQEHVLARLDALHKQMDDHMRRLREVAEKVNGVREAAR